MTMTRDEAEKLIDILVITTNLVSDALRFGVPTREEATREQLKAKETLLTALTTDTDMYEGEPKEEWRKNEEKIEACAKEIQSWRGDHGACITINETKQILTKHFGGKP